jgi:hypothetical protein
MSVRDPKPDVVAREGAPPGRPNPGLANRARIMTVVNVPMRLLLGLPFRTPLSRAVVAGGTVWACRELAVEETSE